jgi:NAD(P)H-hydrate repair Nnr-like enzyme with NAD(P)H-hydrate epimerase domain
MAGEEGGVEEWRIVLAGQGNNYGDKTVGARENDLLRICLFLNN